MNKYEAKEILNTRLARYKTKTYRGLQYLLNEQNTSEVITASGTKYQLKIQAVWDDKKDGGFRIIGAINNYALRSFMPIKQ